MKVFQIMRARCKTPNHIHAPTTVQRRGHGLSSIWTRKLLFAKLTVCPDVLTFELPANCFREGNLHSLIG